MMGRRYDAGEWQLESGDGEGGKCQQRIGLGTCLIDYTTWLLNIILVGGRQRGVGCVSLWRWEWWLVDNSIGGGEGDRL